MAKDLILSLFDAVLTQLTRYDFIWHLNLTSYKEFESH